MARGSASARATHPYSSFPERLPRFAPRRAGSAGSLRGPTAARNPPRQPPRAVRRTTPRSRRLVAGLGKDRLAFANVPRPDSRGATALGVRFGAERLIPSQETAEEPAAQREDQLRPT